MTQQELDKLSWLPTVTYEQFLEFEPCWLDDKEKAAQLKEIGSRKKEWNALDVLQLEEVDIKDRMWAVLREDFLPANILHEYACRCADYALSKIDDPDPRSVRAVEAKRKWLRGEITDEELDAAQAAARNAAWNAAWDAVWAVAQDAARNTARDAVWAVAQTAAQAAVRNTARAAVQNAVWAAVCNAAQDTAWDAVWAVAQDAAWKDLLEILIDLIKEAAHDAGTSTSGKGNNNLS